MAKVLARSMRVSTKEPRRRWPHPVPLPGRMPASERSATPLCSGRPPPANVLVGVCLRAGRWIRTHRVGEVLQSGICLDDGSGDRRAKWKSDSTFVHCESIVQSLVPAAQRRR